MAMVTLNTTSDAHIPRILPYKTSSNNICDTSFSNYFSGTEDTSILPFAESNRSSKPRISTANHHLYLVSKKVAEDNEIDVFNAEKYFNEEVEDDEKKNTRRIAINGSPILPSQKKDNPVGLYSVKLHAPAQSATPSIRSESSLNSRRALLLNIPRNHLQKRNKSNRKSFLAALGCHCPCGDKNSVDIDENIGITSSKKSSSSTGGLVPGEARKSSKDGDASPWMRQDLQCKKFPENDVKFPACNSKTGNNVLEDDDTRRKSLEVFGSPIHRKGNKSISSSSLDRSIDILTWDAIVPKVVEEVEVSAKSGRGYTDDTDSDASSDLFEIESFSTNPSQYLARHASDCMDSGAITPAAATACYAPSEASIEWSVVTASAADFSAMSDTEELRSATTPRTAETFLDMAFNRKKSSSKETQRRRTSILSGCNSHKAVNVAADVVHRTTTNEKVIQGKQQKSDFLIPMPMPMPMPMTRFHAENELSLSCFDKRNGHFSYDASLLTCSQPRWASQVMHNKH